MQRLWGDAFSGTVPSPPPTDNQPKLLQTGTSKESLPQQTDRRHHCAGAAENWDIPRKTARKIRTPATDVSRRDTPARCATILWDIPLRRDMWDSSNREPNRKLHLHMRNRRYVSRKSTILRSGYVSHVANLFATTQTRRPSAQAAKLRGTSRQAPRSRRRKREYSCK